MLDMTLLQEEVSNITEESIEVEELSTVDIAIIGIAVNMPKARNIEQFWKNLSTATDFITPFPQSRRDDTDHYLTLKFPKQKPNYREGGYLERIDQFDPAFFRLSPREAGLIAPDQRLFLETAWNAIEDAGYAGNILKGSETGVYLGYVNDGRYGQYISELAPGEETASVQGNLASMTGSRIAYLLDLRGPSITVDTACSSSLVAVHMACQGIRNGECELAIAGSVKTMLLPIETGEKIGIESSDYRTRSFDDSSDGTGMGEGVAATILKPLNQAVRDQDQIYAVIKGSAINQDGNSVGLTAPNVQAQEKVLVKAWENAGIDPTTISYIEAHGTGTKLGDPIEIEGITKAFQRFTDKKQFCAIGSVKTNLGHLDHAAGITGLIKTALSLKFKKLIPNLYFQKPNQTIDFENSPVQVNTEFREWNYKSGPKRCGVSAFGLSGTNCHIVLEEAPEMERAEQESTPQILTISAKSEVALANMVHQYRQFLKKKRETNLSDFCYSANTGRGDYEFRHAIVIKSYDQLLESLEIALKQKGKTDKEQGLYYGSVRLLRENQEKQKPGDLYPSEQEEISKQANANHNNPEILAALYTQGAEPDWQAFYQDATNFKISVPGYVFDHRRCWVAVESSAPDSAAIVQKQASPTIKEAANFPVNLTGRVDGNYSKMETLVAEVWGNRLGLETIDISADYYQIGGDSILAIAIVNAFQEKINVEVEITEVMEHSTLSDFARLLEERVETEKNTPKTTIPVADRNETLPLSWSQERLWFLDQFDPNSHAYNIPFAIRISGKADIPAIEKSMSTLITRHESLRTVFQTDAEGPKLRISETLDLPIQQIDLSDIRKEEQNPILKTWLEQETQKSFNIATGPLLACAVVHLGDAFVLYLNIHHIISDGWSLRLFAKEFLQCYQAWQNNGEPNLPELPIQFADFAKWQRDHLASGILEKQLEYWTQKLENCAQSLQLPTDFPRPATQTFNGETLHFVLPASTTKKLKTFGREEGITLFMTLLGTLKILFYRYSGQEDILIGSPISNRNRPELENIIGFMVNTLVLRSTLSDNQLLRDFLLTLRETCHEAYSNQDVPFEKLIEALPIGQDQSRTPLFQTLFTLQNVAGDQMEFSDMDSSILEVDSGSSKFDMNIYIQESEEDISGFWEFNTDLFRKETVERMFGHYLRLLEVLPEQMDQPIAALPLLTESERSEFDLLNNTAFKFPEAHLSVHQLLEEKVNKNPDKVALYFEERQLTYKELNQKANVLAHFLIEQGIGENIPVGLHMERSMEMVVALLAIMKAGGAYVPLDPAYPTDRLRYMVENSGLTLLLTEESLSNQFSVPDQVRRIAIDSETIQQKLKDYEKTNPSGALSQDRLAYVIYTSGSTGNPKGVQIPHSALTNFLLSMRQKLNSQADDRWLAITTIAFDISKLELFLPWITGASCVLAKRSDGLDGQALQGLMKKHHINWMQATPATWQLLIADQWSGDSRLSVLCGGEALTTSLAKELLSRCDQLWNVYGPTEATVWVSAKRVKAVSETEGVVPIGGLLNNTTFYVLDEQARQVPVGVPGELHIGGANLATGYRNLPELTREKFIANPFSNDEQDRLYKTGDLVRFLPDGDLDFLGRIDNQVKIHGYRIELGEIETVLLEESAIREAVVVLREDTLGEKILAAYLVTNHSDWKDEKQQKTLLQSLKKRVFQALPEYMMPASFLFMESLPLTPNGKVNRKALPAPNFEKSTTGEFVLPVTPMEEWLLNLWRQVLKRETISVTANFFEVGGHSLLAARMIATIRQQMNVELPLKVLFSIPTIRDLAQWIDHGENFEDKQPKLVPAKRDGDPLPLSFAQQRLWLLDQFGGGDSENYNLPFALKLEGNADPFALEKALNCLLQRHESLRTIFTTDQTGTPEQVILEDCFINLPITDLTATPEPEKSEKVCLLMKEEAAKPFRLDHDLMLRTALLKLDHESWVLLLTMHHIASDGWSQGILISELSELYRAFSQGGTPSLPKLPVQYADYAIWQKNRLQGEFLNRELTFWKNRLSDIPEVHNLPFDRPRPAIQTFRGANHLQVIDQKLLRQLHDTANREGATLFMILQTVFALLIAKYSGEDDIVMGSPIANRDRTEIESLIGFFVNSLVLRTDLSDNPTFRDLLRQSGENLLEAMEHPHLPFDKLVEELQPERNLSFSPIIQIMIGLQNHEEETINLPGLKLTPMRPESEVAKFDLTLNLSEQEEGLYASWDFNTDLFNRETIEKMASHFLTLLNSAVTCPEKRVGELTMLSEAERKRLLVDWNQTEAPYEKECCLQTLIERQVDRNPEGTAVVFEKQSLTYAELNRQANQLAHYLIKLDTQVGDHVGLCMEPSLELPVAILAILKAGAAYVPLDANYPHERLTYMLDDAGIEVLLTLEKLQSKLPEGKQLRLAIDNRETAKQWANYNPENPEARPGAEATKTAYVIYTSGSTGQPKGVLCHHRGVVNMVSDCQSRVPLDENSRGAIWTSISFDVSVYEIFSPLLSGGTLYPIPASLRMDDRALFEWLDENQVTSGYLPGFFLRHYLRWLQAGKGKSYLRRLLVGVEPIPEQLLIELQQTVPTLRIINGYGPSETHICSTLYNPKIDEQESENAPPKLGNTPIGVAVRNSALYVLDKYLNQVPQNVPGELFIGGDGVSNGYHNRPELTKERFINNPFVDDPDARLYRTGDKVRYRENGVLEFIGRVDYQVKLRGFRVELGEVEKTIASIPGVESAVVAIIDNESGEKQLIAWYVSNTARTKPEVLKQTLSEKLPEYMIPSRFVVLEQLPLTPSGKVNRKALPKPVEDDLLIEQDVQPTGEMEKTIAEIWQDILQRQSIQKNANFFDLGGTSLRVIQLRNRLEERLNRKIPVTKFFEFPTIRQQAEFLSAGKKLESSATIKTETEKSQREKEIAIIGMYGKFPNAKNIQQFWQNLIEGKESIQPITDEQLREAGVPETLIADPKYIKSKPILDDVELFDAAFFGYTPREAEILDPQQRFLLEGGWSLLETAGYDPKQYDGKVGVYTGVSVNGYSMNHLQGNRELLRSVGSYPLILGNDKDYSATRLAYQLGLEGPAVAVQTACSTSLVAIHMASESLRNDECEMAIAGACSIPWSQQEGYLYEESGIASSDGHCRPFDAKANGTIFGSGVGLVLLKRLSKAQKTGDTIHAVIKGSAINNDGDRKVGFTAPSPQGQSMVIRTALENAAINPETISYVEAHGTGTSMGDPIEFIALTETYQSFTKQSGFCGLGSVKSNVGHLDTAAGVTGLIKTVMAMKHQQMPPTLHFEKPNPAIEMEDSPFYVVNKPQEWKQESGPRRAAVSSFGIGGTNAHLILEEAPKQKETKKEERWNLFPLSAKTETALRQTIENLNTYLKTDPEQSPDDIAGTLQQGRSSMEFRQAVVGKNRAELLEQLEKLTNTPKMEQVTEQAQVVFMFPGQGSQYPDMALELYQQEERFRTVIDRCCDLLQPLLKLDLRTILFPSAYEGVSKEEATALLQQTQFTQPALFVIEYALAKYWMGLGLQPEAMIGHSVGEYVATTLANSINLEDALRLIALRGKMISELPSGSMLAVSLSKERLLPMLNDQLSLAAENSTNLCVVSGPTEAIEILQKQLQQQGTSCRILHTSHAFHSLMMEPILESFELEVAKITFSAPTIPYISNVTGEWIQEEQVQSPQYWSEHLRGAVLFNSGIDTLSEKHSPIFLEVGPGATLCTFIRQKGREVQSAGIVSTLRHPSEKLSDLQFFHRSAAKLWMAGVELNWAALRAESEFRRVPLPTYPFEGKRYWVEPNKNGASIDQEQTIDLKTDPADWFSIPFWKPSLLTINPDTSTEETCLILIDGKPGETIANLLEQQGATVLRVKAGKSFQTDQTENCWSINPRQSEDYDRLLQTLTTQEIKVDRIIHTWGMIDRQNGESEQDFTERYLNSGFYTLLCLARAIEREWIDPPLKMSVITNGVHSVTGRESGYSPLKSTILGACKVLPQEFPNIECRQIDLESGILNQREGNLLIREIFSDCSEPWIANRNGARWVRKFESLRMEAVQKENSSLRSNGVYLITGGMGGIGMAMAEFLAKNVQAKIILSGRSSFPKREEWTKWLETHETENETSVLIQRFQAMEKEGAEILPIQADVTDIGSMRSLLQQAKELFGTIHGVVHAAGFGTIEPILRNNMKLSQQTLSAKLQGTMILNDLFQHEPLDFMMFCSSMAAVLGGFGRVDYTAANLFLDFFAEHRSRIEGKPTISVNWPAWNAGMSLKGTVSDSMRKIHEAQMRLALEPEEGTEAFQRILQWNHFPQVLVSKIAPETLLKQEENEKRQPTNSSERYERPESLGSEYEAPENELEQGIVETWQELLGIDQIGRKDNFFELGGHSLLATTFLTRIRKEHALELSLAEFFEDATPEGVALHIFTFLKAAETIQEENVQIEEDEMELEL